MTHLLRAFLLLTAGLLTLPALGQRTAGLGDWQLHLPTTNSRVMADAGDRLYVAANSSFYVFDKDLKTVQLLSRRDGLSDVGVSTVAYDSVSRQVLVGYRSGTIDILRADGQRVATISDIQRRAIQGGKEIAAVSFGGRYAYLTTPFGIVVLDLQRREIRDTYINIGPGGTTPRVLATTVLRDSLYAATEVGVLVGALNTNLLDFNRWRMALRLTAYALVTHAGQVYAGVDGSDLYRNSGNGRWQNLNYGVGPYRALRSSAAGLVVAEYNRVTVLDGVTGQVRSRLQNSLLADVYDAVRARSGPLYVADNRNGLLAVSLDAPAQATPYRANAPDTASAFGLLAHAASNTVTVFSGGFRQSYEQLGQRSGFFQYDAEGRWTNVTAKELAANQYPNPADVVRGTRTPDGTLYVASYGGGLLEWKGPGEFRQFVQGTPGSPLLSAIPTDPRYTRLTDVASDSEGNVWVLNRHQLGGGRSGLFVFTPGTAQWRTVPYFPGSEDLGRIVLDDENHAWVISTRRGVPPRVTVTDLDGRARSFGESEGLPSTTFYSIAKDRNGAIWVATEAGVAVLSTPANAFDPQEVFTTPFVQRGAGSGFATLYSDVVRAVAVDGANRKWFGTDNGLWLFNEGADEALQHFTTANSPLPSNRIVDVAVNDRTGEVWVATEAGVVAYRGSATVTEGKPECVKVFPNPVRPDFAGRVGISGIANNAEVKITDITGTLVYQTRATGGTVEWNLADYNGRRVQSGVYLVLTSDAQGENGCIAKVAVVNGR
ncbi:two-component regulator propeller domain-containing protein [Hymenobacter sp. B81]|uniref:type IX secretion system anionic LPS delivery protein PorZ n=1 Tax=Hymenobacter sp. B81 TaxID=3344878 RepID=UPI0037DD4B88